MSQAILPPALHRGDDVTVVYKSLTPDVKGYFVSLKKDDQLETFDTLVISHEAGFQDHGFEDKKSLVEIPLIDIFEVKLNDHLSHEAVEETIMPIDRL